MPKKIRKSSDDLDVIDVLTSEEKPKTLAEKNAETKKINDGAYPVKSTEPEPILCTHYVKVLDRVGVPIGSLDDITPACVQFYYHYQFTSEEDAVKWHDAFSARYSHIQATVHAAKNPFEYQPTRDPWQGKYD